MTLAVSFAPALPETLVAAIVAAEAAGVDLAIIDYGTPRTPVDPLAIAAAAAMATDRIRLAVAVSPAIVEPFTFARGLAALDHLSGGRSAWRVVGAAGPFRASVEPAQQAEFTAVVAALCESWSADALIDDKANASFWRPGTARPIARDGAYYQVTGPLNTPRPPQGTPPRIAWSCDAVDGAAMVIVRSGDIAPPGARTLVDVTHAHDAASPAGDGFHARLDAADPSALQAFVDRFGKVSA